MKLTAAVAATVVAMATSSYAQGVSLSGDVVTEYNTDTEVLTLSVNPELATTAYNVEFTLGSDIAVYNDEFVIGDVKPTLDFGASYMLQSNVEVYGKVSYNLETESRGDVVVGAKYSF